MQYGQCTVDSLNSSLYYATPHVHVFETKAAMWQAGAKLSPWKKDGNGGYGAITLPIWRYRYEGDEQITAPKVGNVLFYKECLGSECISHEAVHMATSYLRLIQQLQLTDQIDENEEKLAYCIGSCMRQIVDNLYKLKIL
ncbi:hypothetical protein [Nostoc sp. PA-18-2419]|uniref:hypothetical protein n=1 Tax=Nostoc sp. PA-18-2419 TaxID=2575443 RepID=UPI001109DFAA|nr:hypothetical protein [Nostoc sp. PA-18-2419]